MSETYIDPAAAGDGPLIEDLVRRVHEAAVPEAYELAAETSLVVRTLRDDERLDTVNLERYLAAPCRNRGSATLHEPSDFASYVNRLADEHTTVWGDEKGAKFTAVFNDHHDSTFSGWRDHTATLVLQKDPEWQAWLATDNDWFSQTKFAEFLEDHAAAIVEPAPADFLEVAMTFRAHRKAEFSSDVNLTNGDVQLTYNEETTAKTTKAGQIEVPRRFTVMLAPYLGVPAKRVEARLRWSVEGGQLHLGYRLHRPDLVQRDAFADIRAALDGELNPADAEGSVPVLLGNAPQPIHS